MDTSRGLWLIGLAAAGKIGQEEEEGSRLASDLCDEYSDWRLSNGELLHTSSAGALHYILTAILLESDFAHIYVGLRLEDSSAAF